MLRQICRPKPLDPDKDAYNAQTNMQDKTSRPGKKIHIKTQTNMQAKTSRPI